MSLDYYNGLPVFQLTDVLAQLPLPSSCPLSGVSSKWRCIIAPVVPAGSSDDAEEKIFDYLNKGIPCFLGNEAARAAHDACGQDALDYLNSDSRWSSFPKPQVAVRSGWGAPGTTLDSSEHHKLIQSFKEVFEHRDGVEIALTEAEAKSVLVEGEDESVALAKKGDEEEILEMQLFHRDDPSSCPQLPPLGNTLAWPSVLEDAAVCDVATSIAQRGSLRWWRLNDAGEFVLQAALPLKRTPNTQDMVTEQANKNAKAIADALKRSAPSSSSAGGSLPTKVILMGGKGTYDWFLHDDEASMKNCVVAMDIFQTPDEALPDMEVLPILTVAVLHSGGCPLLTPPNLPSTTISLNDCVVVEQRRISNFWLDDVSYFLTRCAGWTTNPMIYEYVDKDLQEEQYVTSELIPTLMETFRRHDAHNPYERAIRQRVVLSLYAIATQEKHFALSAGSRTSLLRTLTDESSTMCHALRAAYPTHISGGDSSSAEVATKHYWNVHGNWPKPGCVMTATSPTASAALSYIPVVYCDHRMIYGSNQDSLQNTVAEFFDMKDLSGKRKELLTYLRIHKQKKDDILDELF